MAGINIFTTQPGKVIAVDGNAVPIGFAVDGDVNLFNDLKAIVTSIGVQNQGGFQFMHALREFIYVYVFTERVGEIIVNGLAFPASCEPLGSQDYPATYQTGGCTANGGSGSQGSQCVPCSVNAATGLERVQRWYECNRITVRAEPITIALGLNVRYSAFLVGMKADIVNPETGIAQFSMRFNFIPNTNGTDEFCFPLDDDCLANPC